MEQLEDTQTMLYITKIPRDCHERDIERLFRDFGTIIDIKVKTRYAFIVSILVTVSNFI
jgi:RNA recognition motif-containing protein